MLKLFHIQDSDRPMYVLAASFQNAIEKWEILIRKENKEDDVPPSGDAIYPEGVHFICNSDNLIL